MNWLIKKILGIVLLLVGFFLFFLFPTSTDYQPESFGYTAIILGFVLMVVGGFLILS